MSRNLSAFALAAPPEGESDQGDSADCKQDGQGVMLHDVDCSRPELDHEQGEDQPSHQSSCEDGQHKRDHAHFKDASSEDAGLPGSRRRQCGGNRHGKELLLLEPELHAFVAFTVDAFENE